MKSLLFVFVLLSQCLLLNYGYQINLYNDYNYKFGTGVYLFTFYNSQYDYYVFVNHMDTDDRIRFDLYSEDYYYQVSSVSLYYYYHSDIYSQMTTSEISSKIDSYFKYLSYSTYTTSNGYRFSFTAKDLKYNYFYFAIHLPAQGGSFPLRLDSYDDVISTIAAIFIILIIFGGCIVLAGCSMGVAKMMGRSPLDGLLCFFILCAICCCRRR